MAVTIGIDLGTSNSCIAFFDGHQIEVLEAPNGKRITPSVVGFTGSGVVIGDAASEQIDNNFDLTFQNVKRLLGQSYSEDQDLGHQVIEGEQGEVLLRGPEGRELRPEDISAEVVRNLVEYGEKKLGSKITGAVITVPAYFEDPERKATLEAGYAAGLQSVNILNEPTAAALAYGLDKDKIKTVAVYDLGGGTFDVAIMNIGRGGRNQTLSTNGNTKLGGIDFDKRIASYAMQRFHKEHGISVASDPERVMRVMREAEAAKRRLTTQENTVMNVPFIANTAEGTPLSLQVELTREIVDDLVDGLIRETIEICERALRDAERRVGDIKEVILVGGMTRMPAVVRAVTHFFKREPNARENPDEVVARGAAIKAAVLDNRTDSVSHEDVTPHAVGFRASGGAFHKIINRGTKLDPESGGAYRTVAITTAKQDQDKLAIAIMEGDKPNAVDNSVLHAALLPLALEEGEKPIVELTIGVNLNGLVSAEVSDGTETISLLSGDG